MQIDDQQTSEHKLSLRLVVLLSHHLERVVAQAIVDLQLDLHGEP